MKKYIREILDDVQGKRNKDYVPPVPEPSTKPTIDLDVPPPPPVPEDLDNQELSSDPAQRVRQLDWQAQKVEERETLE